MVHLPLKAHLNVLFVKIHLGIELSRKDIRKGYKKEQSDKYGFTDKIFGNHTVMKHCRGIFSGAQEIDKHECNVCADYSKMREIFITHVK